MSAELIVTLIVGLSGGGVLTAIVRGVGSWRKGVREGDVARDQFIFNEMKETLASHKADIADLKASRDAEVKRVDALAEENRLYRWTLIGVTDRLRQKPQGTVDDILDYIHGRLPMLRKGNE